MGGVIGNAVHLRHIERQQKVWLLRYSESEAVSPILGAVFLYQVLLNGTDQGVLSNLLTGENFSATFPRVYTDATLKGWVVAILQLGAWLGALINGPFADKISRKYSLTVAIFLFTLGSALCAGAQSVTYLFISRIIAGIAVGQISHMVPLYLAEISPAEFQGALVTLQQFRINNTSFISGQSYNVNNKVQFGSSAFNPYTDVPGGGCTRQKSLSWRLPLALQTVPSAMLLLGSPFLSYSPRWLMFKNREEECRATISRLRGLPIDAEYLLIKASVLFDERTAADLFPGKSEVSLALAKVGMLFTNKGLFRRLVLGCVLMFFQQFTGINAIIYYASTIFSSLGLNASTTSLLATGVLGIIHFIFTAPLMFYVDRWGRRAFRMAGALGTFISHMVVAGISGYYDGNFNKPGGKAAGWIGIAFIWIFGANFSHSWGPVVWLLSAELFFPGHRSQAVSINISCNYMMNEGLSVERFVMGQVTPNMLEKLKFGTYLFFGAFCLLMFLWVWFLVPETRNRTLEEMDKLFGDQSDRQDMVRLQQILAEIGLESKTGATDGSEKRKSEATVEHVGRC